MESFPTKWQNKLLKVSNNLWEYLFFSKKNCFSSECSSRHIKWTFENTEQSLLLKTLIVFAQSPKILKKSNCKNETSPKGSSTFAVYSFGKNCRKKCSSRNVQAVLTDLRKCLCQKYDFLAQIMYDKQKFWFFFGKSNFRTLNLST